jgi:uncharacterized protein (DUF2252 family)
MPLEQVQPDGLLPIVERQQAGRSLRRLVPRAQHATWTPQPDRRDPVDILVETSRHRISSLLPLRHGRMRKSPFAFLRGSAAVMAADLATMPPSGIWVQSCGDCHAANFGTYAAPDGSPVFDITDFDETLPAPFEWDLKRLALSFVVDGQCRGVADRLCRQTARRVVAAYREHMTAIMQLDPLSTWRLRIDVTCALQTIEDVKLRERELRRHRAAADAHRKGYPKLLEHCKSGWRIRPRPQLVLQLCGQDDDTHELVARTAFETYKYTLPEERAVLLDRYRLADVAFKVVGVGNVGTFCAIGLFVTRDDATLLLQLTEAQQSVLAPYAAPSMYVDQGQRVVTGQRIMQGQRDVFLGWTQDHCTDHYCYVRQLKDSRLVATGPDMSDAALASYATLCGSTLARAHARSGDAARIAGYMGSGGAFGAAIAEFAMVYAAQVTRDWRLFVEAIKAGILEARDE